MASDRLRRAALVTSFLALGACRAVLGISALSEGDGGTEASDASLDARADTSQGPHDGGPPVDGRPPPQDGLPPPSEAAASCVGSEAGGGCRSCCHQSHDPASLAWQQVAINDGCLCGDGGCTALCSDTANGAICTNPANHATPPCGGCYDGLVGNPGPECATAVTDCRSNPDGCGIFVDCLAACAAAGQ